MAQTTLAARLEDLYNRYRTALLNQKYYGYRLSKMRKWNSTLEVLVAIGTSSAVASWAVWKGGAGAGVWAGIAPVTAVVAILKPILNFAAKIETYSMLFTAHQGIFYDLDQVVKEVKVLRDLPDDLNRAYRSCLDPLKHLSAYDDPSPDRQLVERCFFEVNRQIPASTLWMP